MDEKNTATEANDQTIASDETVTLTAEEDTEAKLAALQAEKAKLAEERDNYKSAYLKEAQKNKAEGGEESEEDRIRRVTRETLAEERLGELDKQEKELLARSLKELKELKLAHLNRTPGAPASMGAHSESVSPTDTRVTPDQLAEFKRRGWSDADIETYKKNLAKNTR